MVYGWATQSDAPDDEMGAAAALVLSWNSPRAGDPKSQPAGRKLGTRRPLWEPLGMMENRGGGWGEGGYKA